MTDIAHHYFVRRPVQAARLTDGSVIPAIGKWINANGGACSWTAATDSLGMMRGGRELNRVTIHNHIGAPVYAFLGDWIVRDSSGDFIKVTEEDFQANYRPMLDKETDE